MVRMREIIIGVAMLVALAVVAVAAKNIINGDFYTPTEKVNAAPSNGQAMLVKAHLENGYQYIMEPSTFKVGVPVKMEFDMKTVTGCLRNVVIPSMNVRKSLTNSDNIITFTPTQAGEFRITCSMGMGRGTFTVAQNDGTVPADTPKAANEVIPAGSCGSGGGGCGCGGGAA